jgi:hypothetical protein
MNKFQPKIADFGCEIVDAISNGLTRNFRTLRVRTVHYVYGRFNFSSTFGFLRTVENLDCTEESDVRFLIIRCHLAIFSDPMVTSWIVRLQSRSHIVNNSNP